MNTATATETVREEETLESVRANLEHRQKAQAEEERIKTKRVLLENLISLQPLLEQEYQAAKAYKKGLKELRGRLAIADNADLCVEELRDLVSSVKSSVGACNGGIVAAVVMSAPSQPVYMPFTPNPI